MASPSIAWGIDVGNRALKAVRLVRDGDRLRVDNCEVIEHATMLSASGDNRDDLINASLAAFVSKHNIKNTAVAISIAGNASFARIIKLPPVDKKKIPEIVRFEAVQQIPFPLDDVEWSYQLFEADDMPEMEVGIFAIRKEAVNAIVNQYTAQKLNVQLVQSSPLAVYNASMFEQRCEGPTVIMDIGADNTDLIIANGSTMWLRPLPIGGSNFTEALVRHFKLDFAEAEKQKRNAGTSKYARQMFQAMRTVFDDLVSEVQRSLGFYASTHKDVRIGKILAMGGTLQLPGLQKYIEQRLSLPVERLEQFSGGVPTDAATAAKFSENVLSLGCAYGLAAQLLGEGVITSSLLPESIRQEKMWAEKTKWFALAAGLGIVAAGVAVGSVYMQQSAYASAEGDRGQISQVMGQAKSLDGKWSELEGAGTAEKAKIANYQTLTQNRDLWPRVLTELRNALPPLPAGLLEKDAARIKSVPRGQRQMILIESIGSVYRPDMTTVLSAEDFTRYATEAVQSSGGDPAGFGGEGGGYTGEFVGEGGGGGYTPAPAPTPAAPEAGAATGTTGFIITIRGVTPNEDLNFVKDTFVQRLLDKSTGPDAQQRTFYYAKAEITGLRKVRDVPERLQRMQQEFQARVQAAGRVPAGGLEGGEGGEFGARVPAGRPQGGPNDPTPFLDPLTGEDRRTDTDFKLVIAVVLGAPPAPAPAPATPPAEGN